MATDDLHAAAQRLLDAHATRAPFASDAHLLTQSLAFAYDVQDLFQARRAQEQPLAGYKIGLTTPRMQKMCGLDHPIAGQILSGGIVRSPARLQSSRYVRLGLECEVAVKLARTLDARGADLDLEQVAACVEGVCVAFEIIEDRAADYARLDMPSLIADNSWNAGAVLSEMRPLPDLANLTGRLWINGEATDSGSTADVLGHPLTSVHWLATHLAARGCVLDAGQWVLTGSIVPTRFPKPGDAYRFEVEGLPPVAASIA